MMGLAGVAWQDRAAARAIAEEVREALGSLLEGRDLLRPSDEDAARVRAVVAEHVAAYQRRTAAENRPQLLDPARVDQAVVADLIQMGFIQPYIDHPNAEEITVNGPRLWVHWRDRGKELVQDVMPDDEEIVRLAKRQVGLAGKRLDAAHPWAEVALPDGSRLTVVIPPSSLFPCLAIRKFLLAVQDLDELVRLGSLPAAAAELLRAAVLAGVNILISGPTGSGKTTVLNCLASVLGVAERVVTVEEVAELALYRQLPDCVPLVQRTSNVEGQGEVTMRDLVKESLRMRPTRIVVGEVRGGEAFDMLLAWNTGHDGSLSSIHANSPRDAVMRLANLALMAEERISYEAVLPMVMRTVELVVQVTLNKATGERRVTHIFEVDPRLGESTIRGQDLWERDPSGGPLRWTGLRPLCLDTKILPRGVPYALPPFEGGAGPNGTAYR